MDLKCSETIVPTPYARMENLHLTCLSRTTPVSALACDEFHESELISLFILSWYSLLSLSFQKSLLFGTSYISFLHLINFALPHGKKKCFCVLFSSVSFMPDHFKYGLTVVHLGVQLHLVFASDF